MLSNAALYIFIPALLFRTTARLSLADLPWNTLAAFFVPVVALVLLVYAWQRRWNRNGRLPTAAPSVRAISASFGNTVQVGIPMAAALFGETGLAIHIAIVSLHALVLLTLLTSLVELDLARARQQQDRSATPLGAMLLTTARNTLIHPVVLPVVAGLAVERHRLGPAGGGRRDPADAGPGGGAGVPAADRHCCPSRTTGCGIRRGRADTTARHLSLVISLTIKLAGAARDGVADVGHVAVMGLSGATRNAAVPLGSVVVMAATAATVGMPTP